MSSLRGAASIIGVAELAPARDTGDETELTLASKIGFEALDDAGVVLGDVDGLLIHPLATTGRFVPATLAEFMGLQVSYAESVDLGGATSVGMLWRAASAIASGMCSVCLCVTSVPRSAKDVSSTGTTRRIVDLSPFREFEVPYGNIGATEGYALIARRYEHEFGDTSRARAKVVVQQRMNAHGQPKAYFSDRAVTEEDVLDSEMIADPLRKLEIVMPTGGAAAVVVARREVAERARWRGAHILGAGEAITHKSISYAPNLTDTGIRRSADRAFAMAGIGREEIGLASLYDCYTITVLLTLEDAGFCEKGAAASFVNDHDLTWRGDFPLNTHGGQLSFGQADIAGGMSHVVEAVLQLQGRAGDRQIANLDFAFVNGNGGIMSEQSSVILGNA